jgi:cytosine deaminase
MMTREDLEKLYDMISVDAAAALNLGRFEVSEGAPANLVVLEYPNVVEALRFHGPPAHVISNGQILDPARMRALAFPGRP